MNIHNRIFKYIMAVLLLLYIAGMVILNFLTPNRTFSDQENRKLEQAPKFSFEALFQGDFTKDFEKYIADQFPLRDFWVGIESDIQRVIGRKESNDVFIGKDGYLLEAFHKPSAEALKERMDAINTFAAKTPKLNKYFMLVPNSVEVLSSKLPKDAPTDDELQYTAEVKKALDPSVKFIDVYDTLNTNKEDYIFYRTDHHWTTKGAFYAYQELAKTIGITPHDESYFDIKKITDSFYGSLYSKGGFRNVDPDSVKLYEPKKDEGWQVDYEEENKTANSLYDMSSINKKDKYTVFFGGNHSIIKITTNTPGGKKLLVVKDSYANSLLPFLTGHYSEIFVVDLRYYYDDVKALADKYHIDDMLILYNMNTFFEDDSITYLYDEEAEQEAVAANAQAPVENSDTGSTDPNMPVNNNEQEPTGGQPSDTPSGTNGNGGQSGNQGDNSQGGNTQGNSGQPGTNQPARNFKEIFSKDVFMGDSISEGLTYYGVLDESTVFAKKGMSITGAPSLVDQVAGQNPQNIYILYGVNDMDDRSPSTWFVNQYANLVHKLKAKLPNAHIYIQSILPVQAKVEQRTPHINNKHINECNEGLAEMAKQEDVGFINIREILNDGNQNLYEQDGTHFKADFYKLWLNYVVDQTK